MNVFYIHSHITFVISLLYIENNNIKDVRFITSRSYKIRGNYKVLDLTSLYEYLEKKSKANKLVFLRNKIIQADKAIINLINKKEFVLFVPQFNHSIFQILATHPLCKATMLIEEGITSYKKDKFLYSPRNSIFTKLISKIFGKRFQLYNGHYFPYPKDKFKFAICLDDKCFPFLDSSKKQILKINQLDLQNYDCAIKSQGTIFILDSFKERTRITPAIYFEIIKDTINLNDIPSNKIYVKFHPEQSKLIRTKTIQFIQDKFNFEEIITLSDDCILELEFMLLKELIVIGMHTSLLYYAKKMEHTVISSLKLTSKIPEINRYIDHIMDKDQIETYISYGK